MRKLHRRYYISRQNEGAKEGTDPGGRADAGPLSRRARVDPHHQHTLWDLAAPCGDALRNLGHDAVFGDLDAERGALNLRRKRHRDQLELELVVVMLLRGRRAASGWGDDDQQ